MKPWETFTKQEGAVSTAHSMGVVINMKIEPPKDEENGDLITTMSANIMVILKFLKWGHERKEILPESQILPDPFPGLVPLNVQNNFLNMVYGIGSVGFIISISFMVQTNFQCYNPILCWLTTSAWAAHQGRPPESPERCHTECEVAQNESLHSVQTASQTSTCLHTQKIAMLVAYRTSDSCSCLWLIAAFYMLLHVLASCRWLVCSQKGNRNEPPIF